MSDVKVDVVALALDELGRVVLSDDRLSEIECCESMITAGANHTVCGGTNTPSCTNNICTGSANASCTNYGNCWLASNNRCAAPNEVEG